MRYGEKVMTMDEYIDREALMRRIKETHCAECDSYHGVRCRACWVDDTLGYIDSEPAADVAPVVHGRIVGSLEDGRYRRRFSCCGEDATMITQWSWSKYCPNCGAKIDG